MIFGVIARVTIKRDFIKSILDLCPILHVLAQKTRNRFKTSDLRELLYFP